jgi:predicted RNA-binding Zn-ribbon protein involved in translation (DUF1610 family)
MVIAYAILWVNRETGLTESAQIANERSPTSNGHRDPALFTLRGRDVRRCEREAPAEAADLVPWRVEEVHMALMCEDCGNKLEPHETIACDRCKKDGVAFDGGLHHVYSSKTDLSAYQLTQKVAKDYNFRGHALQWQGKSFECPFCGVSGTIVGSQEMTTPRGRSTRIDIKGGTAKTCASVIGRAVPEES